MVTLFRRKRLTKNYTVMTDKIIWLDGHVTTISSEEAFRKQYEFIDEYSNEWRMKIGDSEFAWHGNCWMQL